jgi:hypothetical protein
MEIKTYICDVCGEEYQEEHINGARFEKLMLPCNEDMNGIPNVEIVKTFEDVCSRCRGTIAFIVNRKLNGESCNEILIKNTPEVIL